jgi:hypothetical protein
MVPKLGRPCQGIAQSFQRGRTFAARSPAAAHRSRSHSPSSISHGKGDDGVVEVEPPFAADGQAFYREWGVPVRRLGLVA